MPWDRATTDPQLAHFVGHLADEGPGDLPECERLGLKAIMFPDVGNAGAWTREWRNRSDEEIDKVIRTMVQQAGDSEAVLGYYTMDEPGARHFAGLAKAVAAVRKHAPGKLAYISLFPNYATVGAPGTSQLGTNTYMEYLERFVAEVKPQLVSYDNYMTQVSGDMAEPTITALYYTNLMDVRTVATQSGLPFWNIVSSKQIRPPTTVPSPANLLLQAYTTLAAGGSSVAWYKYYADGYAYAPIEPDGTRTQTWQYLRMVNEQLRTIGPLTSRLTSTGVYFTAGNPPGDLPRLPGKIIAAVGLDTPVMVGEFCAEDGADWVMVVNLSLQRSARLLLETAREYGKRAYVSPTDGRPIALDEQNSLALEPGAKRSLAPGGEEYRNGLWLTAGQGLLLRFER